jgi:hypothetical protein
MVFFFFQYCMAYNVFIRTSDCEMCNKSRSSILPSLPTAGAANWSERQWPERLYCTNQNCAVKERNKPSRKQEALGHTSRLNKWNWRRLLFKRDVTRAETGFCLSVKRTSPFKLAGGGISSVHYWQSRWADQRSAIVLSLASTFITALKCRYKAGRSGYKGVVRVK